MWGPTGVGSECGHGSAGCERTAWLVHGVMQSSTDSLEYGPEHGIRADLVGLQVRRVCSHAGSDRSLASGLRLYLSITFCLLSGSATVLRRRVHLDVNCSVRKFGTTPLERAVVAISRAKRAGSTNRWTQTYGVPSLEFIVVRCFSVPFLSLEKRHLILFWATRSSSRGRSN